MVSAVRPAKGRGYVWAIVAVMIVGALTYVMVIGTLRPLTS
jgi:hypothetical protein